MQITDRFQILPFWRLTRWGCLFGQGVKGTFIGFACDEFHNRTFYVMIPLVGFFTLWYERDLNWTTEHVGSFISGEPQEHVDPDCDLCAEMLGWNVILQQERARSL